MPSLDTSEFLPAIRQAIDLAAADARAKPADAAASGRLGMVLHAHQQLVSASVCYHRAAILDPQSFSWPYYRGVAEQALGHSGEAAELYREALTRRDYLPAKIRLGEALLAAGDSAAAAAVFEKVTDNPAGAFGYGRAANKPEYFEKAVREFPQYGAAMFALAQHYQRSGRPEEAARLMREYPKFKTVAPPVDDPMMDEVQALNAGAEPLLRQAISLEAQGQLAAAAELNEKALQLDPKLVAAHVNLVSAYGRLHEPQKAEAHYRQAIALNPNAVDAHYNFGVLCISSNRIPEAKSALETALRLNPDYAEAHSNYGAVLQMQGNRRAAQREFEKAIELQPNLRAARFQLGRLYANDKRWDAAVAQFRQIVQVDDEATPAYLYALGATLARSGDIGAADTLVDARNRALQRGQASLVAAIDQDLIRLKAR